MPENRALGIDVSEYDHAVNWQRVAQAGVSFAFAKAPAGTNYKDPTFDANWPAMKDRGILRGAYHYFHAREDPIQQAAFFTEAVSLQDNDLPPVLDVEGPNDPLVSNATRVSAVRIWLTEVERRLRRRPLIYTNPDSWNRLMSDPPGSYPTWTPTYHVWVAHWDAATPTLPRGGWTNWTFWQWCSPDCQPCDCVQPEDFLSSTFDYDVFNGSVADLRRWLQVPQVISQVMINAFDKAFGNAWDMIPALG